MLGELQRGLQSVPGPLILVASPGGPSCCGDASLGHAVRKGLKSPALGIALTNRLVPPSPSPAACPRLLSRLRTSVEASLFFPLIEEAVLTAMLKDEPPAPPSLSTYPSCYLLRWLPEQLVVG